MKPAFLLKLLLPFVPSGYRTAGGAVMVALGTFLAALASPDVLAVIPPEYAAFGTVLQGWGAAVAALGLRARGEK